MRKIALDQIRTTVTFCEADKRSTTYLPVAKTAKTFSGGMEMAEALGVTQIEDHNAGVPFKASLVCRVDTGIPGHGYFDMARKLGVLKSTSPVDEFLFWKSHMDAMQVPIPPAAVVTGRALGLQL